jgi:DNA polymerase-3 subunit beta
MKISVNSYELAEAVNKVSKACAVKETQGKILEGIKFVANNDQLTLTATDSEMSIETTIKCDVLESGSMVVAGKIFAEYVNKVASADSELEIKQEPNNQAKVTCGKVKFVLSTMEAKSFPILYKSEEENSFEIEVKNFKKAISQTAFCCATDESRPILKGCLLETSNGKLTATALDGFRMACSYCDVVDGTGEMKIVCPARTLTEISRMLGSEENTLKIYASKNLLYVAVEDTVIMSRLLAGEFVRKENIYPVDFVTKVNVKRTELIDSIERASVLIRGDKNNLIQFDIKMNKIVITANSEMGKVEETVGADLDGKELKIAMNGKFILDAIKALNEETIVLSFNTSISPFVLENAEDNRCQYLVLPVRTTSQAN